MLEITCLLYPNRWHDGCCKPNTVEMPSSALGIWPTLAIGGRKVRLGRRFGYVAGGGWVLFAVAILGVSLIVTATPAQAVTFDLTSCHVTGGCGTQTVFGTVTLTQNGTNVDFVVALAGGNRFVQTGAAGQELFKFNGAAGGTNITNAGTGQPLYAVPGGPPR